MHLSQIENDVHMNPTRREETVPIATENVPVCCLLACLLA